MSLRLDMLQAAGKAPSLLRDARDRVVEYLLGQIGPDGAGKDRAGHSDLYYTVFVLEGLLALGAAPSTLDRIAAYLWSFGSDSDGRRRIDHLDFVHLTCLARCSAALTDSIIDRETSKHILEYIESRRSKDGGYGPEEDSETGTIYHCFLALGAYQDLGEELPNLEGMGRCISSLRTEDGAYANEHGLKLGTTPTTAAAATLMGQMDMAVPAELGEWLLKRCHPKGGFLAMPEAPMPDLLSTATALHALAQANLPMDDIRECCLNFLESLWTEGGFRGHQVDDSADAEYTYYALLALGHLSD